MNRVKSEVIEIERPPSALKESESFPVSEVTEPSLPLPEKQETHIRKYALSVSTLDS
jgi:hypothetical protein